MSEAPNSRTPLRTTFKIKLNGETVPIATVGQAYRFITNLSAIERMEFRSLHGDAVASLQEAADSAMLTVQKTACGACHRAALRADPLAHPGMTNKSGASRACETPASFG